MKDCKIEDIVKAVKVALDEDVSSNELADLMDLDTLTLEDIIRSKVEDGARLVHMEAPHWMLDGGVPFTDGQTRIAWKNLSNGWCGSLSLPTDFLRLVVFKMSDWTTGVTDAVSEDSDVYLMQGSPFAGIRGNKERPVVAILHGESGLTLEFYGCRNDSPYVERALCIPVPAIKTVDGEEKIALCSKLERATVYRAASLVALTVKDGDAAAALLATSNRLAEIATE